MNDKPIRLLLIEDSPGDARLIREMLNEAGAPQFELVCVERLEEGLKRLGSEGFDLLLLDLGLPDSQGLDTFFTTRSQAPGVPIVVLTGLGDETSAIKAVREGAQDYLVKGQVNSNLLVRSIRYALERQRLVKEVEQAWLQEQDQLRALSLVDELTGLYNRRGFLTLAHQQSKLANRTKKEMLLLFADLDNLKWINDTQGHHEGDLALLEIAKIMRETFRESDIIARVGGDEFAVLATGAGMENAEILIARLQQALETHNTRRNREYELSISVGVAAYDPQAPCSVDELLARADRSMYEHKRSREGC